MNKLNKKQLIELSFSRKYIKSLEKLTIILIKYCIKLNKEKK